MIKSWFKPPLKAVGRVVVPRTYWRYQFRSLTSSTSENELALVPVLTDPTKTSIDVGAAHGLYVAHMLKSSLDCVAFEPRTGSSAQLKDMVDALGLPVRVEQVALSNTSGQARMRILVSDPGRSTIEDDNELEDPDGSALATLDVTVKALDDYDFDAVGLVKIDVEGHEMQVIEGAMDTIAKHRPNVLVEVENRHKSGAVSEVFAIMDRLDYAGYFIHDGDLHPVDVFDEASHQDSRNIGSWRSGWRRSGVYINNFVFVPREQSAAFLTRARSQLGRAEG